MLHPHLNNAISQLIITIVEELTIYHADLLTGFPVILWIVNSPIVDYFVMGEAIGIVARFFVAFYFSRKQMQKFSTDIAQHQQQPKILLSVTLMHIRMD